MSTESTTPIEPTVSDDLDAFAADFFGRKNAATETTNSEVVEDVADDTDAPTETVDTQSDEIEDTDTLAPDDENDDTTEVEEETPAPKKNRFQERIDELTSKYREEQRRREELERRLSALEAPKQNKPEPTPTQETPKAEGPDPYAKNEDGSEKYPLGEYDPRYVADLARFTVEQQFKALETQKEEQRQREAEEAQKREIISGWQSKMETAQERYPDLQEKGQQMLENLGQLDPVYEDYLSATIMNMDYGPDVLYYLASNPAEAKTIINAGPTKAAVALGRIEAKFAVAEAEKVIARPKVSGAPNPPPVNKGASAARVEVPDDTDDLDAFSRKMFKKKR